jgi:hypothetical protein
MKNKNTSPSLKDFIIESMNLNLNKLPILSKHISKSDEDRGEMVYQKIEKLNSSFHQTKKYTFRTINYKKII